MKRVRRFLQAHRPGVVVCILLLSLGCFSKPIADWLTQPCPTSFLVQGDTDAITFTSLEQTESGSQAGLFASPDTPVDLEISCAMLRRLDGAKATLSCPHGFLKLNHVFMEALRLGRNTRVELHVADKNLSIALVATTGEDPLITFVFDGKSNVAGGGPSSNRESLEGEWSPLAENHSVNLTLLQPHFHSGNNEGGQQLRKDSVIAFQREGHSAFVDNKAMLLVAAFSGDLSKPIADKVLQVSSLQSGEIRTLSPVKSSDGSLGGLHVEVKGISDQLNFLSPVTEASSDQALNRLEYFTGAHLTFSTLLNSMVLGLLGALVSVCVGMASNHHSKHLNRPPPTGKTHFS